LGTIGKTAINSNGHKLNAFASENELKITNTLLDIKKFTKCRGVPEVIDNRSQFNK
jgi:hypothetical protein